MAERRMLAKTIIRSDAFLEMPTSTQCLYFQLNFEADDEGFVNNPRSTMRIIGCNEDDMRILIGKKFILPFESGVIVIKHWKIHNYIRGDRLHETKYKDEKASLSLDENGSYTTNVRQVTDKCQTVDGQVTDSCHTEVRLGKDRLGKVKKDIYGAYKNVTLSKDEMQKLIDKHGELKTNTLIEFLSAYREDKGYKNKSDYLAIGRWVVDAVEKKDKKSENPFKDRLRKEIEREADTERNRIDHGDDPYRLSRILSEPK